MKNCEFLIKKKIPFEDIEIVPETSVCSDWLDITCHYLFRYDGKIIGYFESPYDLPDYRALLIWLQKDHSFANIAEKELIKRAVSDLGRLHDPDITVRWYYSGKDRVLHIEHRYEQECGSSNWDSLWKMKLTDTGFEFNGMIQDQRYSLKELGI